MTDDVHVVLKGDLDYPNEQVTRALLAEAIQRSEVTTVVVDCAAVTFMDSCGIRELVWARNQLDDLGRGFRVENLAAGPRRVLDVTGLLAYLNVTS